MIRFFQLVNRALWRAFSHDAFTIAKAAAYSSVLTLFPAVLVIAWILAATNQAESFAREIGYALGRILPPGSNSTALALLKPGKAAPSVRILISAGGVTVLAASGIMISWMEGFRNAYQLPKIWGFWKERLIALLLIVLAIIPMSFATIAVGFGGQIETWMIFHATREFVPVRPLIFLFWSVMRWIISILTSIAAITLIYHYGVPRTQPWHRVIWGAVLATCVWLTATLLFGWYVKRFATYNVIYGSLGAAIALLVWMYINSIIILIGAEFNALRYPRAIPGIEAMEGEPVQSRARAR